ncbi:E3 ubiquitin-protein ligase makorin isoform X3 [Elaeis guineensis]|uniref:E3 ubiquitin-protein ligase makorin isoform X2 n=1 Tax=Elaeis guineensis var. tenera TaxID=51953 RepID=A0A6I9QRW4_ELAGV|nr:E3 ubiquitin-protein ligase makorin isoform X2 [Elaeis guineensis]
MSRRILCKYFAHGACLKGEYCEFSHDWKAQPNNVCTFYQKGVCSYGSRCRYDHVKVSRHQASASSSSSSSLPYVASDSVQITHPHMDALNGEFKAASSAPKELTASSKPFVPPGKPVWTQNFETHTFPENEGGHVPMSVILADLPICSFAAAGSCPYGEKCPHIHGDLCSICGKHCLHPHRLGEREEHIKLCQKNNKRLEALKLSQEIECSVCLDRVLSKPTAAERKFGLLSECDHPFCISCIRNWRSNSPASGMDVNNAVRACPICRKISYFVIPSVIWYSTKEEKQEIVDNYKAKLKSIDCKYFDFGNGTCPFGTSCFYRDIYNGLGIMFIFTFQKFIQLPDYLHLQSGRCMYTGQESGLKAHLSVYSFIRNDQVAYKSGTQNLGCLCTPIIKLKEYFDWMKYRDM